MDGRFHASITREALGPFFDGPALDAIVKANLAQDSLLGLLSNRPHTHFDNNLIAEGWAYVEDQHGRIERLARQPNGGRAQRIALGRLCHAVQDFYAHSNYVALWLEAHGGLANTVPSGIADLDADILDDTRLCSGYSVPWRDWVYYSPGLKHLARRVGVPPDSHEAMNQDSPDRGPLFAYAVVAARHRTLQAYRRAAHAVEAVGGPEALDRFHTAPRLVRRRR